MKILFRITGLALLVSLVSSIALQAQNGEWITIKTPMGQTVNALKNLPTQANIDAMNAADSQFTQMIKNKGWLVYGAGGGPSYAYQCHGYAWHMYNKSTYDPVELNGADVKKYYTNDAVVQIPPLTTGNWVEGVVIVYGNLDNPAHSAVTTGDPGWVVSKWYYGARYKHKVTECPWGTYPTTYFKVPITGNDKICTYNGTANYTTTTIPGATYTWTALNTPVAGNASSVNITNTFSPASGWIKVSIYSPLSNTTIKGWKRLCVGNPSAGYLTGASYDIWGSYYNYSLCPSTTYNINVNSPCSVSNYNWTVSGNFSMYSQSGSSMTFNTGYGGTSQIEAHATVTWCPETTANCCYQPGANVVVISTTVDTNSPDCYGWSMSVSPNPSSEYVEIEPQDKTDRTYRLVIYNSMRMPVYELKNTTRGKLKISTTQFPDGVYVAQLMSGKETISKRFIVRH